MDRYSETEMLQETLQILDKGFYEKNNRKIKLKLSRDDMTEIMVFMPDDVRRYANMSDFNPPHIHGRCRYSCENADSYTLAVKVAKRYGMNCKNSKGVLVLNMANPVNPGGGVRHGARAQEEDLCRRSSLLLSLESSEALKYYEYHRKLNSKLSSGALMITPHVEIIKDENGELYNDTVTVSVLTFAAPYIAWGIEGMSETEYENMLFRRITDMLKCAAYLGYKHLVLGAWGCGAFLNDAHIMSDLFYRALKELNYNGHADNDLFSEIDFAVLDKSEGKYNFNEFYRNFGGRNFYRDEINKSYSDAQERIKATEKRLNSIRGCLVGGAAGDALGYPVEFMSESSIFSVYGECGITEYDKDPRTGKALISDDTQMTLFTANGLLFGDTRRALRGIGAMPRAYVAMAYMDWFFTQENEYGKIKDDEHDCISWLCDIPGLYSRRAPGTTCMSALMLQKLSPEETDDYTECRKNDSKGCGGVMRVAPLALCYGNAKSDELDMEGAQLAAITHGNSLGYMPAAVLTHIINRIVFSTEKIPLKDIVSEAEESVKKLFAGDSHLHELTDIIDLAVQLSENDDTDLNNIRRLGQGWVAEETLAIAIYCSLRHTNDFSAGITSAVNHSGDSDSTGAVTGNILGALLGYDAIDMKWKKDLELIDIITEIADDICHGCQMSEYDSYRDADWIRKYIEMKH